MVPLGHVVGILHFIVLAKAVDPNAKTVKKTTNNENNLNFFIFPPLKIVGYSQLLRRNPKRQSHHLLFCYLPRCTLQHSLNKLLAIISIEIVWYDQHTIRFKACQLFSYLALLLIYYHISIVSISI